MYLITCFGLWGTMRIDRIATCYILVLGLFMAGPAFGQAAAKSAVKSITVYKTPT